MYREYFNILTNGEDISSLFTSIALLIIVGVAFYFRMRIKYTKMANLTPFILIFGIFLIVMQYNIKTKEYRALKKKLLEKKHSFVEGEVTNLLIGSQFSPESFTVSGVEFSYYDDKSPGFHQYIVNGGPIKEGLDVRIFYYENKILGLWIKD